MIDFEKYTKEYKYRYISFGKEVIHYLKKCLKSNMFIPEYITSYVNLKKGITITYLPEKISYNKALEFEFGGKIPIQKDLLDEFKKSNLIPKLSTNFWIKDVIENYVRENENNCLIQVDSLARPKDPCLKKYDDRILVYKNEVYNIFYKKSLLEGEEPNNIGQQPWPTLFGILTKKPKKEYKVGKNTITEDEMKFFVQNLEQMIFNAYDEESFLIWSKDKN